MELIAEILEPGAIAKILRLMGLTDTPPRLAAARSPPDEEFEVLKKVAGKSFLEGR